MSNMTENLQVIADKSRRAVIVRCCLIALAHIGQFAALFPFAVLFEALSLEKFTAWHFFAIYAVWIVFWAFGLLIGKLINRLKSGRLPKILVPVMNFLSKTGFAFPTAAFIALCVWLKLGAAVCFYVLPAGVIIYFGGNLSVERSYSDIFSKVWFVLYMVSAILSMLMISTVKNPEISSDGGYMLCVGFAVVILLSAVLANQTNIDTQTKQRDSGRAVLPNGLRRYNALIVIGIFALTFGLFVFAKPIANLLKTIITTVVAACLNLFEHLSSCVPQADDTDIPVGSDDGFVVQDPNGGADFGNILFAVLLIAAIVAVIVFRKQILAGIKNLLAPLFRSREKSLGTPFADEITSSDAKTPTRKAQKKAARDLARQYARETSPKRKYRLGYALFLARLRLTEHPPTPSDTTDVHREKGETAFGEDLREFSETYNKVRYADLPPTAEELTAENELLQRIK